MSLTDEFVPWRAYAHDIPTETVSYFSLPFTNTAIILGWSFYAHYTPPVGHCTLAIEDVYGNTVVLDGRENPITDPEEGFTTFPYINGDLFVPISGLAVLGVDNEFDIVIDVTIWGLAVPVACIEYDPDDDLLTREGALAHRDEKAARLKEQDGRPSWVRTRDVSAGTANARGLAPRARQ